MADDVELHGYTPGPWLMAAKPSSIVGWPVVAPDGRSICTLNYVHHSAIDPKVEGDDAFNRESRANGRLIARAPELLDENTALRSRLSDMAARELVREAEIVRLRGALASAIRVADEARDEWDAAPEGMKAGKLLIALSGHLPKYRADIDAIHAALATPAAASDASASARNPATLPDDAGLGGIGEQP